MKDEFGLNFTSQDPMRAEERRARRARSANLAALLDTLQAHGILPIARIVVFKDSVDGARESRPHDPEAGRLAWRDKKGLTWVNPYDERDLGVQHPRRGRGWSKLGFGEIQFDYIRFPEPYKSLPQQVFPEQNGRVEAARCSRQFLKRRRNARLNKLGVRTTADIFGLVTTVGGRARGRTGVGEAFAGRSTSCCR